MSRDATGGAGKLLSGLSPEKRRLLLQDMLRDRKAAGDPDRIPRRDAPGPSPLSFAQQRLWLVDRLEPGSAAYNMPSALRLRGVLDTAALRATLGEVARRHEALRTVFEERGGTPVQVVRPPAPVALPVIDLRALPRAARERRALALADAEALDPFDLVRGPLLRALLIRLDDEDHVLCFTLHHVVSDGWSMGVLVREVSAIYGALSRGREPELPDLPVQYADYAAWQRSRLGGDALEGQLAYWRERLAGAPRLLEIPTDRPRAAGQGGRAGSHAFTLPAELSRGLRELAHREGATLFMALLAAWQTLLGRYAGQDDVVVGSPAAGRTQPETEGLIGFFVNLLALRGDLGGDPTWSELLGRARQAALGAYAHQELPFERLVEELAVERSLAHAPLFQVVFALEQGAGPDERLRLGGLEPERFGEGARVAQFDLDLTMQDSGEALGGTLAYRSALFDAATIARMARHLEGVVGAMVADPRRRLSELSLVSGAEREQVRHAWNATDREFPAGRCLHELVAEQARRTPDAPAVVFEGRGISHGELDARANRLAHGLRRRGVGPEVRVGVGVDRGPELAVALLAVLRAGGAYVPLDPAYPAERIAHVLRDSGAALLLTQEHLAGRISADGIPTVALEALRRETADGPAHAPASGVGPQNLAYVIYTSGSTGMPKGAAVPHRAVVNFAADMAQRLELRAGDRFLQFASPGFDVVVEEIFPAWLAGAAVVFSREELFAPETLLRVVAAEGVTVLELPTAYWHEWVRELARRRQRLPGCVRMVLVGGERLAAERLREWAELRTALVHVFGLTETACTSTTLHLAPGEDGSRWSNLPIGRPTGNARVYVLDRWGQLLPPGIAGELFIGGEGVGRGYLGRPGLTAERFVPDALGGEPGARLYRTGDRVRWLGDGTLEFLGRVDHQVKVRGFRIEPGEVEAALLAHPAVREAVVTVREDVPGEKRLVGYVAAEEGAELAGAELRAHLAARVPEHLVPGAFVVLASLPLTLNGKVDRAALPAPEHAGEAAYAAPRTATEEVLAGIWEEVLGVERVGVQASFFELGGHSLLATQVVSRSRGAFGVEVPLRALFEAPTVAGLAGRIDALRSEGAPPAPPIERVPRTGSLPLSFAQQRLWLVDRMEPGSAAYNVPIALRLRGELDVAALRASLDALTRRHETLRTTFAERGGAPVQVVHPPAPVPLPVVDLGRLPAGARERLAERLARAEAMRPFDLARGPLVRSTLLPLGGGDHALFFTLHHVVSDEWSMEVLVREVSALYAASARGADAHLPGLPVQYADFATWQRGWLSGEVLDEQIGFWKEQLAGAPPLLELPVDRPRAGAPGDPRAAGHAFALDAEVSRGLRALARREGATLFMTLLAAWQALLGRWAGEEDVVVGTPVAGRTRAETEGLIGFFVNMLALRGDLSGDPTWSELLGRTRETALGAYAHQELPFERLVEVLGVERSLAHSPVFQAVFALNRPAGRGARLSLGDVELAPLGAGAEVVRFDVSLAMTDGEDGLGGTLVYREALFEAATVARMAGHLEAVLEAMAARPGERVREVQLLRGAERAQVLEAWNATAADVPGECVHEMFAAQAARTPAAVAVRSAGGTLTYAELERRSGRLARHLRRRGVGPETTVGVLLERSAEMVVGVLGILRAGGAYLPLDPHHPPERLRRLLAEAGAPVLLTQASLAERVEGCPCALVRVDADASAIAGEPEGAPAVRVEARGAAYVIHTSGSTGTPRGVVVEHGGLANYLRFFDREVLGAEGFALPLVSRLAFDAHVRQLFPPLLRGEAVWVLPEATAMDPAALLEALSGEERVSFGGVPSLWSAMLERVERGEAAAPRGLVAVLLGGEALPEELARRTRAAFPGVAVWNHYGPTEATVNTTVARMDGAARPSLGRPIANVRAYVLDARGEPSPLGAPGELYVGGAGVARGYLGRPGLTAERFVPDALGGGAGARLYRTGDRVRWLASGELEFLGRIDQQLKIRGFRVEPGEIEAALRTHERVREAAVLLREDVPGQPRLVAYVAGGAGTQLAPAELRGRLEELRRHVAERLPEYMVPAAFVALESIPKTSGGKVDRRALPAPEWTDQEEEHVAPRTVVEELVAGIWAEVLGTERVGVTASFFALGGHSLLATQVVSRLGETFGVEVPLRTLFEMPTVEALSRVVEDRLLGALDPGRVAEHLERLEPDAS
ncbi:MAG: amino acid adenylation domain-containing protein [Longimicrobiaceae bacterium]